LKANRNRHNAVVLTYVADSAADPETAWRLIARPEHWSSWAPPVRGARGLGQPEVRTGATGHALLVGRLPVPARVTSKQAHRSWTWEVGPLRLRHRVRPQAGGCRVAVDIEAPFPLEALVRLTYGPMVSVLMHNLARVAAQETRRASRRAARSAHTASTQGRGTEPAEPATSAQG
jgi:hypothetical protein